MKRTRMTVEQLGRQTLLLDKLGQTADAAALAVKHRRLFEIVRVWVVIESNGGSAPYSDQFWMTFWNTNGSDVWKRRKKR